VLLVPPGQAVAAGVAAHATPDVSNVTPGAPVEGYDSYSVVLSAAPFGPAGTTAIAGLRQRLSTDAPGALVGGNPAIAYDEAQTAGRDDAIIVPLVLAMILGVTGGVITAAGIVLAGTFAALTQIPEVSIAEVGTAVALGVLLDTLLVRTVLVPASLLTIGERVWWPARSRRATDL
jgi:MMPL family